MKPLTLVIAAALVALAGGTAFTQSEVLDPARNPLPNPTSSVIKDWGKLPAGRRAPHAAVGRRGHRP